jgi:ABC-type sugar transport system permease subunit
VIGSRRADTRLGLLLVAPAVAVMLVVAIVPVTVTFWDALHRRDLRLPWLGHPFVGAANFQEAVQDPRFLDAVLHTVGFVLVTVPIELSLGVALALVMRHAGRLTGLVRVTALLPWAIPTVVAALVWRFMFDAQAGVLTAFLRTAGIIATDADLFVHPAAAWVPIAAADIWKTTPFVAVLVLAGLHSIDRQLYEAARVDGATPARQFFTITLPLLLPVLVVAGAFRALDALRLFDLPYVMTGGGPGSATEPLSLYAYLVLMQRLRFGYGSALSVTVFLLMLAFALVSVRALSRVSEPWRR